MLVRFGFVAMSLHVQNASPSKTMTVKAFKNIPNQEAAIRKLTRIAMENLTNTKRILYHCLAHDIQFYRFSSRLIPLAGHELVKDHDFLVDLLKSLQEIGEIVQENQMRVGFHPDHFTVLNTPRPSVLATSIADLKQHKQLLEAMGLGPAYKCNIHVGGSYGDKTESGRRFVNNFQQLDPSLQQYICLENDDKTFTAKETLQIAQTVGVPMVLDLHHHRCNHDGETLEDLWPEITQTWKEELFPPKIHISSEKSPTHIRSHADYVHLDDLMPFLSLAKQYTEQLDVMIEAKKKDEALFDLMKKVQKLPHIEKVNEAAIWVH